MPSSAHALMSFGVAQSNVDMVDQSQIERLFLILLEKKLLIILFYQILMKKILDLKWIKRY